MSHDSVFYKGFEIKIQDELDAVNPWEEWNYQIPLVAVHHGNNLIEYNLDLTVPELTREEIKTNAKEICDLLDCKSLLRCVTGERSYKDYGNAVECINYALSDHMLTLSPSEQLNTLVDVYTMQGIPTLVKPIHGYSQNDYANVLVVATPDWLELTGLTNEKASLQLAGQIELYSDYVFGNTFWYEIQDSQGKEIDGVFGFYGNDHEKNGLLYEARLEIDAYIEQQRKLKTKQIKQWIRNKVPLNYRTQEVN